jgi:hypothetical protein
VCCQAGIAKFNMEELLMVTYVSGLAFMLLWWPASFWPSEFSDYKAEDPIRERQIHAELADAEARGADESF